MKNYDLNTQFDSRASFYGKARVTVDDQGNMTLTSYSTDVATIADRGDGPMQAKVYGTYSATTLRHIKEFLKQNGFKAENSKQIMADYGVK